MIIERVLDELEQNNNYSNYVSDNYIGEKGILQQLEEKMEENHIDVHGVLDDLKQDEIIENVHAELMHYNEVEVSQ